MVSCSYYSSSRTGVPGTYTPLSFIRRSRFVGNMKIHGYGIYVCMLCLAGRLGAPTPCRAELRPPNGNNTRKKKTYTEGASPVSLVEKHGSLTPPPPHPVPVPEAPRLVLFYIQAYWMKAVRTCSKTKVHRDSAAERKKKTHEKS